MRDQHNRIGWVLGRLVDVDVPLEIAQYAEGQRFVAFFPLNEVHDGDKQVPQYLAILTENKDGQPDDFTQVRVFTWNVKKHRYETAYRERNLAGVLPVTVTHETFDKEGDLPVFILRVKDDAGATVERKYKLNTPLVKRVLAPGEVPAPRTSEAWKENWEIAVGGRQQQVLSAAYSISAGVYRRNLALRREEILGLEAIVRSANKNTNDKIAVALVVRPR